MRLSQVFGFPGEDGGSVGLNGNSSDNSANGAGAAYLFVLEQGQWRQQAYIKASNTGVADGFGVAVAISSDGATLAVGAADEDSAATGINGDQSDDSRNASGAVYLY